MNDPVQMLLALDRDERENGRVPVALGVMAAYLLDGALLQALTDSALGDSVLAVGQDVREQISEAFYRSPLAPIISELKGFEVNDPANPGERYRGLCTALLDAERAGGVLYVQLGPFSSFVLVSLLQLTSRSGHLDEGSRGAVVHFARQLMPAFSAPYQALLEMGFDPSKDVPEGTESGGIQCPRCHTVSFNADDIDHRYCGRCHAFHDQMDTSAVFVGAETGAVKVVCPECPVCHEPPALIVSLVAAYCGADGCPVVQWNPSLPGGGLNEGVTYLDLSPLAGLAPPGEVEQTGDQQQHDHAGEDRGDDGDRGVQPGGVADEPDDAHRQGGAEDRDR